MTETAERIRVGVFGGGGKVGSLVCQAVSAAPDLTLVAGIGSRDDREPLASASVAVDFTHPDAVLDNVGWCLTRGINVVVGTSGIDERRLASIRELVTQAPGVGVIVVPNFCISAILAMNFAARAARYFDDVEIIDLSHRSKVDAPSGTAVRTAELMRSAREQAAILGPDGTWSTDRDNDAGERSTIGIHSIRLEGLVSHQKVVMSRHGELFMLSFDTLNRAAFMPGVLMAVRAIDTRPGLTLGLEPLLELDGIAAE